MYWTKHIFKELPKPAQSASFAYTHTICTLLAKPARIPHNSTLCWQHNLLELHKPAQSGIIAGKFPGRVRPCSSVWMERDSDRRRSTHTLQLAGHKQLHNFVFAQLKNCIYKCTIAQFDTLEMQKSWTHFYSADQWPCQCIWPCGHLTISTSEEALSGLYDIGHTKHWHMNTISFYPLWVSELVFSHRQNHWIQTLQIRLGFSY